MSAPGEFAVTVDPRRCEGEAACVKVCPARVFRMAKPPAGLPIATRIKVALHGGRQAVVHDKAACIGCMRCVSACPECAIEVKGTVA